MAILAKLLDMDFKFVLPRIYINFDIQTNFKVNHTQISHSIPKNTPKSHLNGHISKPHLARLILDFRLKIFGGLNQKSASISMCKIHIYIDSECFRQTHWKI